MKRQAAELREGPEAFDRFRNAVKAVLAVPKSALPPRPQQRKRRAARRKG